MHSTNNAMEYIKSCGYRGVRIKNKGEPNLDLNISISNCRYSYASSYVINACVVSFISCKLSLSVMFHFVLFYCIKYFGYFCIEYGQ